MSDRQHISAALHHSRASDMSVVDYAVDGYLWTLQAAIDHTRRLLQALEAEHARNAGVIPEPPATKPASCAPPTRETARKRARRA